MKFSDLNFDNHFEKLGKDFFSKITPKPLEGSQIIAYSAKACELINLDEKEFLNTDFCDFFSAKKTHPNFCNLSAIYAGHQFGYFVSQLGDGRACLLSQITNQKNESFDLVLKGCGLTPYSRQGDGKAVLRSSIREFLISESMFALNIPTSRALCLIASNEKVYRDGLEKAAQIIRLAPSHVRFGSFELFFYRKQNHQIKILTDYVISKYFPQTKTYSDFLENVVESTAKMIAKWQAIGFCHGVMNTDNMSIHGITFDYGPFGFLDEFNRNHICNSSDHLGRYSFANQPAIGFWNLHAFAITLSSLIEPEEQKKILENYEQIFLNEYHQLMAQKLGFIGFDDEVKSLIYQILDLLEKHKIDYTIFFRQLANQTSKNCQNNELKNWNNQYFQLLKSKNIENPERKILMNSVNPKFILRNYLLQNAIQKAELENDFSEVKTLQKIMQNPFDEQNEFDSYAKIPPIWAKEIKISCSS
jgi:uncharacterized protein YdiU (UPF0061 family)